MFHIRFLLKILKNRKLATCLLALPILTSCEVTAKMWEHGYEEEIEGFIVSDDRHHVALLGKKFDYFFEDQYGAIAATLGEVTGNLVFLDDEKTHIKHRSNGIITGHLVFESFDESDLSQQKLAFIQGLGFKRGKRDSMIANFEIKGRRYPANEELATRGYAFKQAYHVEIHQPNGPITTIEKTIATPITLTADAFLFIGESALKIVAE